MTKDNFLKGAAILGIAGILIKIMGAVYRMPLGNMIGPEGLGYYQTAYPLYVLLLTVSTSGFPVAIAKLVSERRALADYRGAQRIFKIALIGSIIAGVITSVFIVFAAKPLVLMLGNRDAYYALIALSPGLLFVPIMSAFRGYFQGRQNMTPTALSQIVEQLLRVSVGLFLAYYLLDRGIPAAAGGAMLGGSVGAIASTIAILGIYFMSRKSIKAEIEGGADYELEPVRRIIRRIFSIAIPIMIGASIVPIMDSIDIAIVLGRLQTIGFTEKEANDLLGQLKGFAQTFVNLPQVLSIALAMSLVPAVSGAYARKNFDNIKKITGSGVRVTLLIGLPAALGLFVLATPIVELIFFKNDAETLKNSGDILRILSFSVIFLTLVQSLTAIMQGLGKPFIPVRNLAIGAVVKVILTYILTGVESIGIKGAAFGTVAAYFIAAVLNLLSVRKHTKTQFDLVGVFLKPVASAGFMTLVTWLTYRYVSPLLGGKITTVLAIAVGGLTYGISLLVTGTITSRDFDLLPGGAKMTKVLKNLGLLRS